MVYKVELLCSIPTVQYSHTNEMHAHLEEQWRKGMEESKSANVWFQEAQVSKVMLWLEWQEGARRRQS